LSEYSNKEREQLYRDIPGAVRLEILPERFAALVGELLAGESE
jgi:hypothetical protein